MMRTAAVLLLSVVSLLPAQASAGTARQAPGCCPPPPIYAQPAVTRWDGHSWQPALVLAVGDRVRFSLRFYTPQPAWKKPFGNLEVQRIKTPQYRQPVIARAPLQVRHTQTRYVVLSAQVTITSAAWLGAILAQFNLRNGSGAGIGASVQVLVRRPPEPRIWTVPQILAHCAADATSRTTIWLRGFFHWLAPAGPPYSGWLFRTRVAHPTPATPAVFLALPNRYLAGNLGPPPNGPLFAHGVMQCRTRRLRQDRYPLFP